MTVTHLKKKDVVKSKVRGVDLEFDHEKMATILGVPGKNGICEYIKEVWEESKYTKPLEITRRFANDDTIVKARRVKSVEMKPSRRFIHFTVMKNVIPRVGKRDTTSFMDLGYMDHLAARRLVNLPRVMMRHMSYVISVKDHELPYGDWLTMVFEAFGVPLVDKKGEEPKRYDFFEETFLTMCKLTRENGIWWIGSGENRRRDDDEVAPEEEAEDEDEGNKDDFDWEAVIDEATVEGDSGSGEKLYDAEDENQGSPEEQEETLAATPHSSAQQQEQGTSGVDPSGPTGREADFLKFQAEFERKRANRFHDELEKAKDPVGVDDSTGDDVNVLDKVVKVAQEAAVVAISGEISPRRGLRERFEWITSSSTLDTKGGICHEDHPTPQKFDRSHRTETGRNRPWMMLAGYNRPRRMMADYNRPWRGGGRSD
ncbi:hypothetical protein Dimus_010260 [Dionaea muscipula]